MKTYSVITKPSPKKKTSWINATSLFSWVAVIVVTMIFWSAIAFVYKHDFVSNAITKLEQKQDRFLTNHKALHKKLIGIRNGLS